ncbi:uncharacterized protein LOC108596215 [Drosophila busckii]|uniref:uncharacterized protein LOC108596215 n=1 Tax=Drosophila busckii TaxID=30019 RepID=UPI00083F4167|nr:uncharacterized protein LOC108596215 [Drosophila busckii]
MHYLSTFLIAVTLSHLPAFDTQCVDCNRAWGAYCNANVTGFYCSFGSNVETYEITEADMRTSTIHPRDRYKDCNLYPYSFEFIKKFCCLWSPKIGCQVALNREVYQYANNPDAYCIKCRTHCKCIQSSSNPQAPKYFHVFSLLFMALLLF